jgi:hypothetical protein
LGQIIIQVIDTKDLIKVVDDGKGLGLEVLNGAETHKAQLNANEDHHDWDDSFKKEDCSED